MRAKGTLGTAFLILFALPFAGFGVFALVLAAKHFSEGKTREGIFLTMFGLIFCGVGFGLMYATIRHRKSEGKKEVTHAQNPDSPWLWREEWASGRIKSSSRSTMIGAWIFAIFWNAISSFCFVIVPQELTKKNYPVLIALIFPAVGVCLLIWAFRATIRWRKFGEIVFEMLSIPGAIGGALAGTVRIQMAPRSGQDFKVMLTCVNRVTTGSGKNRSTREHVRWQSEQTVASTDDGGVPVLFAIPADSTESNNANSDNAIVWRLETSSEVPGVDFHAQFEVPVFRVALTSDAATLAQAAQAKQQAEVAAYQPPADSPVRVGTNSRGELDIVFTTRRNRGAAGIVTFIFVVWSAILVVLVWKNAGWFFEVIWGLIDLLILYGVMRLWFGSFHVTAGRDGITVTRKLLRMGTPERIPTTDISDIQINVGMQVGSTLYHDIKIVRQGGRTVTIGSSVRDKLEAEWLVAELKKSAFSSVKS